MVDLINMYLAAPSTDAEGRARIVLDQCEFTDGRSAERVAAAIVKELISSQGVTH
jgi:hypothetical protein